MEEGWNVDGQRSQSGAVADAAPNWRDISAHLAAPFAPEEVEFRIQGKVNEQTGRAQIVAYIDARCVGQRLDDVVGAGNWSFDWTPISMERGQVLVAKGVLTVYGVSKADAGTASTFEQSLGAVSHCFKRAAVHWGIGRYLYDLPRIWERVEKNGTIPPATIQALRATLPRQQQRPQTHTSPAPATTTRETPPARPGGSGTAPADESILQEAGHTRPGASPEAPVAREARATEQQLVSIRKLCEAMGLAEPEAEISEAQARALISRLSAEWNRNRDRARQRAGTTASQGAVQGAVRA